MALKFNGFGSIGDKLRFNGKSGTVDTTDGGGTGIKALQFVNDGTSAGGSVFSKNRIRLADDLSFSTAFAYRNKHPQFALGDGGFTFTLQAAGNTSYGQAPGSLGAGGIMPALNIAVATSYYSAGGSGQATGYYFTESLAVFYNGNNDASTENGRKRVIINEATNDPARYTYIWIEYDGGSGTLEIRYNNYGVERPRDAAIRVENLDLVSLFGSEDDASEVYAGFTGSTENVVKLYSVEEKKFAAGTLKTIPYLLILRHMIFMTPRVLPL